MIRQILGWLIAAIVVIGIIVWLISGGFARALTYAKSLSNFGSYLSVNATSSGQPFKLPGQPDFSNTVGNEIYTNTGYVDSFTPPYDDGTYQPDWAPTQAPGLADGSTIDPRTFGNPSPYAGRIGFVAHNTSGDARSEFLVIQAASANPTPIALAGWSLQSVLTGASILLPQASEVFIQGTLNTSGPVLLEPDAAAVIASTVSPNGVSFHVNRCSGYLSQFETFNPTITAQCPGPNESPTLQSADSACAGYLSSLPTCRFPGSIAAQNPAVPEQCRRIAAEMFSYNGCVAAFRSTPGFAVPEWRLFLAVSQPLWKSSHDTIRLLDNEGRVVDVLSY